MDSLLRDILLWLLVCGRFPSPAVCFSKSLYTQLGAHFAYAHRQSIVHTPYVYAALRLSKKRKFVADGVLYAEVSPNKKDASVPF